MSCAMLLLAVAVGARAWLYIHYSDLWIDEANLAFSVYEISWGTLFSGELPFMQSAPLGFLALIKFIADIFGTHEQVLYLVPLFSGIALLFGALVLVRRHFDAEYVLVYVCFLVACCPLILFSVEFKQYTTEGLMAILAILMYDKHYVDFEQGRLPWSLPILFCLGLLFSSSLVFIGAGLGLSVLRVQLVKGNFVEFIKSHWLKVCLIVCFVGVYYMMYLSKQNSSFMKSFWSIYFFPSTFDIDKILFVLDRVVFQLMTSAINIFTVKSVNAVCGITFFIGMYLLFKDKKTLFFPILFIALALVGAFLAKIYPLGYFSYRGARLILFFLPLFFIPVAYCFYKVLFAIGRKNSYAALAIVLLLCIHVVLQNVYFAREGIDIEQTAGHIRHMYKQQHAQTGVILYEQTVPAMLYYQHLQGEPLKYMALERDTSAPEQGVHRLLQEMRAQGKTSVFMLFSNDIESPFYHRSVDAFKTSCPGVEEFSDTGSRLFFCPSL